MPFTPEQARAFNATNPRRLDRRFDFAALDARVVVEMVQRGEMTKVRMAGTFGIAYRSMREKLIPRWLANGLIRVASRGGGPGNVTVYRLGASYEPVDALPEY